MFEKGRRREKQKKRRHGQREESEWKFNFFFLNCFEYLNTKNKKIAEELLFYPLSFPQVPTQVKSLFFLWPFALYFLSSFFFRTQLFGFPQSLSLLVLFLYFLKQIFCLELKFSDAQMLHLLNWTIRPSFVWFNWIN